MLYILSFFFATGYIVFFEQYFENGTLRVRANVKDGEVEGFTETYYEDGTLASRSYRKDGEFDGIWSVEAGPHMPDKQKYADEMLRVLRPGGSFTLFDFPGDKKGDVYAMFSEDEVLRAIKQPPEDTRALVRGLAVTHGSGKIKNIHWTGIEFTDGGFLDLSQIVSSADVEHLRISKKEQFQWL